MFGALTAQENSALWHALSRGARRYDRLTAWLMTVPQVTTADPAWRQPWEAWMELVALQQDVTAAYVPEPAPTIVPSGTGWPVQ